MKTHFKKLRNPSFIGSYELMNGDTATELVVTITDVKRETIQNGDKTDDAMVIYLKGHKPMIVNATNAKNIKSALNTPYVEDWVGKKITLYVERIKAFGDWHDALRVRKTAPKKPALTKTMIPKIVEAMKKGVTIEQVKNKYTVSAEIEKQIENETKK